MTRKMFRSVPKTDPELDRLLKATKFDKKWKKEVGAATVNPNATWERMRQLERETLTVRPDDSFTSAEYAAEMGLTPNMAQKNLYRFQRLGKVVKHKYRGSSAVYWTFK